LLLQQYWRAVADICLSIWKPAPCNCLKKCCVTVTPFRGIEDDDHRQTKGTCLNFSNN
jgi:hypothetical protein